MNQKELAKALGLDSAQISKWSRLCSNPIPLDLVGAKAWLATRNPRCEEIVSKIKYQILFHARWFTWRRNAIRIMGAQHYVSFPWAYRENTLELLVHKLSHASFTVQLRNIKDWLKTLRVAPTDASLNEFLTSIGAATNGNTARAISWELKRRAATELKTRFELGREAWGELELAWPFVIAQQQGIRKRTRKEIQGTVKRVIGGAR